jgi:hypothetical protein
MAKLSEPKHQVLVPVIKSLVESLPLNAALSAPSWRDSHHAFLVSERKVIS